MSETTTSTDRPAATPAGASSAGERRTGGVETDDSPSPEAPAESTLGACGLAEDGARRGEIGPSEKPNEVRPEVAGGVGPYRGAGDSV